MCIVSFSLPPPSPPPPPPFLTVVEPGERALGGKRKLLQRGEPASKRVKVPAYFLPDVAQCVAMTDVKLPLTHLSLKVISDFN